MPRPLGLHRCVATTLPDRALSALRGTCVVVPAFNEAGVIGPVLGELTTLPCAIVVVDDGSSDGTRDIALSQRVHVLRHACNLGQGAALRTGITYALRELRPEYLVTFDADGQHRCSDIATLVAALDAGDCDVVLGSRFMRAQDAAAVPRMRRFLLRAATVFTRLSTGMRVTDTHNGLRGFTAAAAAQLDITHGGMAHASEILSAIRRHHLRWREAAVSIDYSEYSRGKGQGGLGAVDIMWNLFSERLR